MNTHIVRSGENLEQIASRYGLTAGDLAIFNRIPNNDSIKEGQEIKLELPKDAKPITVSLGANDSLDTVAKQFNTSVERIMALNNLTTREVQPGARVVAWDPFRLNHAVINKPQDLESIAKKIGTDSSILKAVNQDIDFDKISGSTTIKIPWQLQKWVEPSKPKEEEVIPQLVKDAKTSSLPQPLEIPSAKESPRMEFPDYKEGYTFKLRCLNMIDFGKGFQSLKVLLGIQDKKFLLMKLLKSLKVLKMIHGLNI